MLKDGYITQGVPYDLVIVFMEPSTAQSRQVLGVNIGFLNSQPLNSQSIKLGISIGSAICPEPGTDIDTLIRNADSSMYRNKRSN